MSVTKVTSLVEQSRTWHQRRFSNTELALNHLAQLMRLQIIYFFLIKKKNTGIMFFLSPLVFVQPSLVSRKCKKKLCRHSRRQSSPSSLSSVGARRQRCPTVKLWHQRQMQRQHSAGKTLLRISCRCDEQS